MSAAPGPVLAVRVDRFAHDADGPPVLQGVRLALGPGSLTAVLGASGSGTTTLARIASGWALGSGHAEFTGALALEGAAPLVFSPGNAPRLSLGAWGREVAFVPERAADLLTGASASVGEEIAFSLGQRAVPRAEMERRVPSAAAEVGLGALLEHPVEGLSGGQLRRLALACALVDDPRVLVLDSPESSLDADGVAALGRAVRGLRRRGAAVVLVGSCAGPLARSADHWVVLGAGTVAAEGPPAVVRPSAAFASSGVLPADPAEAEPPVPAGAPAVRAAPVHGRSPAQAAAELEGVRVSYRSRSVPVLVDAHLAVAAGETVAVAGPNGAGKSTLLRTLAGLVRPEAGTVRITGRDVGGIPAGRIAEQVGTLFQDPRDQLFERTCEREVAFGLARLGLGPGEVRPRALEALDAVGLAAAASRHPYELPGSHQRLLALATVLARRPRVLVLDEPTVGLDRDGLEALERTIAAAAEAGTAVVLATHALPWAGRRADRVLALSGGRIVGT
ncbi:ABC transporter ATP-binding protein [Sinomonas halotolerans]|uniref:ATP-binding cassette domain-containing protein n=1 Tax=Sinomonas halotolerans TaxID=1644133 RepID=A0ABU9X3Q6_9MICC